MKMKILSSFALPHLFSDVRLSCFRWTQN